MCGMSLIMSSTLINICISSFNFCNNPMILVSLLFYTRGLHEAQSCELVNDIIEFQIQIVLT